MKEYPHSEQGQEAFRPIISVESAINGLRSEIAVMGGANDSEFSVLDSIINRWHKKELSDEEAIAAAQALRYSKQDYH